MAKEVDLSSKEWIDLVFEDKNKEFGAYEMRKTSPKRHLNAVIYSLLGLLAIGILTFATVKVQEFVEQQRLQEQNEQEEFGIDMNKDVEEQKEEQIKKPEIEEVKKEEVQNSQKVTELTIKEDSKVKEEMKSQDDIKEDNTTIGSQNVKDGTDDIRVETAKTEVQVVDEPKKEEPKPEPKKEEIFKSAEQMPQFPGGDAALMKYINSHIHYPAAAEENNIQGRVVVQFVVDKNGNIGQAKVVRSVDRSLDNEALRVVKSLPKFIPGKQNGQPVSVWYTLPVTFKLQNAN